MKRIQTVLIGAGYRGRQLLRLLKHIPAFQVAGVADPGLPSLDDTGIALYTRGPEDYLRMIDECRPRLAVIASPWECHIVQALHCLQAGIHVALEIKGGLHIDEYKEIIETADKKHLRIFPLENTLFIREVMAVRQMAESGVFGTLIHLQGGYRHDLRHVLIDEQGRLGNPATEGVWRSRFYQKINGDLYPTHGFAPLCLIAGINRGDRMERLTSFASKAEGIREYIRRKGGDSPAVRTGDVIITQMQSRKGVLFTLTHDTTLPRPRSLDFEVQGTRGIWNGEHRRIYLEGTSPYETWEPDGSYIERYESAYWKRWRQEALEIDNHHQGMDYIMLKALEEDLQGGETYPADGHDLALWTSVSPYSALSIARGESICLKEQ